jgi:transcriptional regulator with XRE-family HTH domain
MRQGHTSPPHVWCEDGIVSRVGQIIRIRRLELDLRQEDLAERTGYEQSYISKVEVGRSKRPERDYLLGFAEALEMDPDDLLIPAGYAPVDPSLYERKVRREDIVPGERDVQYWGVVPADALRWAENVNGGQSVPVPLQFIGARDPESLFVLSASGNCLASRHIAHGQLVLCEVSEGREPRNGQIVAVRVGDERSLKAWHREGDTIELRDGDDNVVAALAITDDIEVVGTVVATWWDRFE